MLPKSRILSALLLGLGVALIAWSLIAPRFVHADGRLPLDLSATTYTLTDEDAQTRLITDGRILDAPVTRQLHMQIMDPVSKDDATLRIGESSMRGSLQDELDRLIDASVYSFRIDRFSGEILGPMTISDQIASPTVDIDTGGGKWLKFPTDAEATTYEIFDAQLRETRPADFVESTEIGGRDVNHYRQVIEPENVATLYADPFNTTTFIDDDAEEGEATEERGFLWHSATRDFFVDVNTGLIVNMAEQIDTYYGTVDGDKREQVLLFDAAMDEPQVDAMVDQVEGVPDGSLSEILNLVVLVVGILLAVIGLAGVFGAFNRRRRVSA